MQIGACDSVLNPVRIKEYIYYLMLGMCLHCCFHATLKLTLDGVSSFASFTATMLDASTTPRQFEEPQQHLCVGCVSLIGYGQCLRPFPLPIIRGRGWPCTVYTVHGVYTVLYRYKNFRYTPAKTSKVENRPRRLPRRLLFAPNSLE